MANIEIERSILADPDKITYEYFCEGFRNVGSDSYYEYLDFQVGRCCNDLGSNACLTFPLPIPQGKMILSAYLRIYVACADVAAFCNDWGVSPSGSLLALKLSAEDADNPAVPTSLVDLNGRVLTTEQVDWDHDFYGDQCGFVNSPDLSAVIQEVVDRVGYAKDNNINIFLADDGSSPGNGIVVYGLRNFPAAECASCDVPAVILTSLYVQWEDVGQEVVCLAPVEMESSLVGGLEVDISPEPFQADSSLSGAVGVSLSAGSFVASGSLDGTVVDPLSLTGSNRVYLLIITGAENDLDDVIIPMASFQSRIRDDDPTFLSVVVPGLDFIDEISARPDGYLKVRMGYKKDGVVLVSETVASVEFEDLRYDEGPVNESMTLTGHITEEYVAKTVTLEEISYKSYVSGEYRVRCKPDLYLRPGDHVIADDVEFDVTLITYSVTTNSELYEITGE